MAPWTTYDFPPLTQSTRSGGGSRRGSPLLPRTTTTGGPWNVSMRTVESNPFDDETPEKFDGLNMAEKGFHETSEKSEGLNMAEKGFDEMSKKFDGLNMSEMGFDEASKKFEGLNMAEKGFVEMAEKFDGAENGGGGINFDAYEDIPVEVSGQDVPPPVNSFAEIDLGKGLNMNIKRCKYVRPTPIQRHAIPIAMAGRDLMACAQTGSGKTAAFCFPIIARISRRPPPPSPRGGGSRAAYPLALILSPTRELASQIHDEAKKFAYETGVKVVVAYGGAPMSEQLRRLERGVDILVATPGRLVDMVDRGRISLQRIRYLAIDEADRMLDMGFEPQIRRIVQQADMPPVGARQTMLFSATFPTEIQRLASDFLSNYIFLSVGRVGSSTDLIAQKVEFVNEWDKKSYLKDILVSQKMNGSNGKHALTIVFVETKRGADQLVYWLSSNGFRATAIHGDKVQQEREWALESFKSGSTPIMVATDVAARGLDIPRVAHVINFDLPRAIDDYVHRIGRTGRAGKTGLATAFFNDKNHPIAKALVDLMHEASQEVPSWLAEYAHTPRGDGLGPGNGNGNGNGNGKFGGHDYRRFAGNGNGNGKFGRHDNRSFAGIDTGIGNDKFGGHDRRGFIGTDTGIGNDKFGGHDRRGFIGTDTGIGNDKFGGNDYRSFGDHYSSGEQAFVATSSSLSGVDPYSCPTYGLTHGYESIEATGWE